MPARKPPPIACEDCGKQFKSHYILILHARYHRKESNYIFQRHTGGDSDAEAADSQARRIDETPPEEPLPASASPPAVLGQMSPPHLPNPVTPEPPVQDASRPGKGLPAERQEEETAAAGEDDDEDYSVEEAGDVERVRRPGVEADFDEEEDYEMESAEELECEICDARFHQVLELLKHIRVHRYELTESNYQQYRRKIVTTYRPSNVRLDLRRLTDESANQEIFGGGRSLGQSPAGGVGRVAEAAGASTEYECDYCGKRFPTASNLRRHIPVHTGERPHQCPFCGCRFGDRSYMLKHTRFVHNVELARVQKAKTRPRYANSACFKCQICNRYFENADILAVHLEKYHSRPGQSARQQSQQHPAHVAGSGHAAAADDDEAEDEYPEEEDALLGGHRPAHPDAETLFSCDQCDFISADLAQLHAHLAEHTDAQQQQQSQSPPATTTAALPVGSEDLKPRLTVTISDG